MKVKDILFLFIVFLLGIFGAYSFVVVILLIPLIFFIPRKSLLFLCFAFLIFVMAYYRSYVSLNGNNKVDLSYYNDFQEDVVLEGMLIKDPEFDGKKQKMEIRACLYEKNVCGNVLVVMTGYPKIYYGDFLRIEGELLTPFESQEFSYKNYLFRYGIKSILYYPRIEKVDEGEGNYFFRLIYSFKRKVEARINYLFLEPSASLVAGLLLGVRRGMSDSLIEAFRLSGLTHIVAVSGYNISLLIIFMNWIFQFFSKRIKFFVSLIGIVIFVILTGMSASVLRAGLMGFFVLWASLEGRESQSFVFLLMSAFFMIMFNPLMLFYDIGFQLSFSATFGLILLYPRFEKKFRQLPNMLAMRESFLMTIVSQVSTLPISFWHFHFISWIAPFSNVLVAPLIPISMLLSFISLLVSFVHLKIAVFIAYYAWFFLMLIVRIAQWSSLLV